NEPTCGSTRKRSIRNPAGGDCYGRATVSSQRVVTRRPTCSLRKAGLRNSGGRRQRKGSSTPFAAQSGHDRGALLDHLVSASQDQRREGYSQCIGGLQVEDQVELGRLLYRQVSRLCALEDSINEIGCPVEHRAKVLTVRHQPAFACPFPCGVHGRQP